MSPETSALMSLLRAKGHNFRIEIFFLEVAFFLRDVRRHVHGAADPFTDHYRLDLRVGGNRHQTEQKNHDKKINATLHEKFSPSEILCTITIDRRGHARLICDYSCLEMGAGATRYIG